MLETVSGNHHVNKRRASSIPPLPSHLSPPLYPQVCVCPFASRQQVPPLCRSTNGGADPLLVGAGAQGEACVGVAWCALVPTHQSYIPVLVCGGV